MSGAECFASRLCRLFQFVVLIGVPKIFVELFLISKISFVTHFCWLK
jgi:hypothetical protein